MKRITDFQTIRSEGGLLPPDLLRRVLDPKAKLDGMGDGHEVSYRRQSRRLERCTHGCCNGGR